MKVCIHYVSNICIHDKITDKPIYAYMYTCIYTHMFRALLWYVAAACMLVSFWDIRWYFHYS